MIMGARANTERSSHRTSITETALAKFRQHAPSYVATDERLTETLDDAVVDGFARGVPEPYTTEDGDDAWLVDLQGSVELPLYGVVKHYRDRDGRVNLNRKALVTIMKKEFVARLKAAGNWNRKVAVPAPLKRTVPSRLTDLEGDTARMITWEVNGARHNKEVSVEQLTTSVLSLVAEGVSAKAIRVWRPLKLDLFVQVS
jgi:hypothetical protein